MADRVSLAPLPDCPKTAAAAIDYEKTVTFFSSKEFVDAWSRSYGEQYRPLPIPVFGSGRPRQMYAIQSRTRYCSRYLPLTRYDFFMSPGWEGKLELSTLEGILRNLMGPGTRGFVWNVRFDHEPLAMGFCSLGLKFERIPTHVLALGLNYEAVFVNYSATIRNHIRKAQRRGVVVRTTVDPVDINAYHDLYIQHGRQHAWTSLFPVQLSLNLANLCDQTRFVVAEYNDRIIGGALFVRDGSSVVYYLHGASDRDYSHLFPACPVLIGNSLGGRHWRCLF